MRIQRIVIACFLALSIGASAGLLKDEVFPAAEANVAEGLRPEHFVDESADRPSKADEEFQAREARCLRDIMFGEARNQSVGVQILIGMVVIARRDDGDPQWKRTICGIMQQKGQISGIDKEIHLSRAELIILEQTDRLASDLYDAAWKKQFLPRGWECVRYWKNSDESLAGMSAKKFAQLGIKQGLKGLMFFEKLIPVDSPPGAITFYRDPNRCAKALPTT